MALADREHISVTTASQWRKWLSRNLESQGVWVVFPKKSSSLPGPTYDELVRVALCFGWIDSVPGRVSDTHTKLYFAPRKAGSGWASTNKQRIDELIAADLMHPRGLAVVQAAKADGSWNRIDGSESLVTPDDLLRAFRRHAGSRRNFDSFPPGVRKQILQWIEQARTPTTREKRIEQTAHLAAQNIRANEWRAGD